MASQISPRIAIIGAGPGGLALARLLHQRHILSTVFERESSSSARWQGGTLDLHAESGQIALKEAGIWPKVEKSLRREGEDFVCADKNGMRHINEQGGEHGRPELDRGVLRKILLGSLPEGQIRWDSPVARVKERGVVELSDGREEVFDLVVGADGAWSKVRPILSTTTPHYSGISGIDVCFPDVDRRHPKIAELVGQGSYFALGDEKSLMAQRNGDGSIRVYVWAKRPETWLRDRGIDFGNGAAAKAALVQDYSDWAPELQALITCADDDGVVPRALYMLPPDERWASKAGFTLLGDAAHLMTPFAGEGVNLALLDALELSQAIARATTDSSAATSERREAFASAVRGFEEGMMERARRKASETWENLRMMMSADAPGAFVKRMEELMAPGVGPRS